MRRQAIEYATAGALIAAGFGTALPGAASAQTPYDMLNNAAERAEIVTTPIRGGVSMLSGSGGNIVALAGSDGIFLVDTGIALSKGKIETALRRLSPGPIRYAVNTHWHWDHADGNGWVRAAGAKILAHPNTIAHLAATIRVEEWGHTFTPVPPTERPTVAVDTAQTVALNGETVRISPLQDGHTDGDLAVRFNKANVLVLGDTWWNGSYPFIDHWNGGSIDGAIRQVNAAIATADQRTRIVPGHGPVGSRSDLIAARDMMVGVRAKIAALKAAGKTLEETIAARPTAAWDAKWGKGLVVPELFVALVWRGV